MRINEISADELDHALADGLIDEDTHRSMERFHALTAWDECQRFMEDFRARAVVVQLGVNDAPPWIPSVSPPKWSK
jgi:hypothetical protein